VNPVLAVFLTVLLGSSMYLAGRLHARIGYRFGYRYGYRQGYFDGDRACWNRVRREAQAGVVEAAEPVPARTRPPAPRQLLAEQAEQARKATAGPGSAPAPGTTYASSAALGRHAQHHFARS
jgi:hypothetical protein